MTKRKPLRWAETEWGDFPICVDCVALMNQPGMAEAIASVGIETGGVDVRRLLDTYHANRHKEPV